jgi:hypothetical protein
MISIYALADPRDGRVRYVGKAADVTRRLQNHLTPGALRRVRHVARWLAGLLAAGLRPTVTILETVADGADWQEAERRWIAHHGRDVLTNLTDGGEGGATYGRRGKPWTDAQRIRYRVTRKGMKMPPRSSEVKAKMGAAIREHWRLVALAGGKKKGRTGGQSEETKQKISLAHKGKRLSAEHRAKLSAAKRGKPSPKRGVPLGAAQKAKMSATLKGRPWTVAQRAARAPHDDGQKEMFN